MNPKTFLVLLFLLAISPVKLLAQNMPAPTLDELKNRVWYFPSDRSTIAFTLGDSTAVYQEILWDTDGISETEGVLNIQLRSPMASSEPKNTIVTLTRNRSGILLNGQVIFPNADESLAFPTTPLPQAVAKAAYAKLHLQFLGEAREEGRFSFFYVPYPFLERESKELYLRGEESLKLPVFLSRPTPVILLFQKRWLTIWLTPGQETVVIVDPKDEIHFAGANAALNAQFTLAKGWADQWQRKNKEPDCVIPEDCVQYVKEQAVKKRAYLQPRLADVPFSPGFLQFFDRYLTLENRENLHQLKFNYRNEYAKALGHYELTKDVYNDYGGEDLLHAASLRLRREKTFNRHLLRYDNIITKDEVLFRYLTWTIQEYPEDIQEKIRELAVHWQKKQWSTDLDEYYSAVNDVYRRYLQNHPDITGNQKLSRLPQRALIRYAFDSLSLEAPTREAIDEVYEQVRYHDQISEQFTERLASGNQAEDALLGDPSLSAFQSEIAHECLFAQKADTLRANLEDKLPSFNEMRFAAFMLRSVQNPEAFSQDQLLGWMHMYLNNADEVDFTRRIESLVTKLSLSPAERELINHYFQQRYDQLLDGLPNFAETQTTNASTGEVFLQELIQKHPNKVLFIDVWATWCGPCIGEFPFSKKLKAHYADQDVVFVYLCGGNSSQKLMNRRIQEHEIEGEHYLLDEALNVDLFRLFDGSGYPTYRVVDRKGNLRPEKNLRPSNSKGVKAVIDLLLEE